MIQTDAARLRADYLHSLDAAMRDLPHGVAAEIRSGIAEELEGLDAAATAARIAQLGEPAEIVRGAAQELGEPRPGAQEASMPRRVTGTRGYAIAAALALSFGGIVVPFVGWIVGSVLVSFSTLWRTWEKVVSIVVPLAIVALAALASFAAFAVPAGATSVEVSGGDVAVGGEANPLLPSGYDILWSGFGLVGFLLLPASGLWLLWRLRGRAER